MSVLRYELLEEYRATIKVTKKLLDAASSEDEAEIIRGMLYDLDYARQYLKCGYDPKDWNSGIHKVEQRGSYHNRRILLDTELAFFSVNDHIEILGDVLQCNRVIQEEEKEKIQFVLSELTKRQLTCYLLHVAHTRSYEEIAEELGIKKSSVQDHIERAREKVSKAVQELEEYERLQRSH